MLLPNLTSLNTKRQIQNFSIYLTIVDDLVLKQERGKTLGYSLSPIWRSSFCVFSSCGQLQPGCGRCAALCGPAGPAGEGQGLMFGGRTLFRNGKRGTMYPLASPPPQKLSRPSSGRVPPGKLPESPALPSLSSQECQGRWYRTR